MRIDRKQECVDRRGLRFSSRADDVRRHEGAGLLRFISIVWDHRPRTPITPSRSWGWRSADRDPKLLDLDVRGRYPAEERCQRRD